MECQYTGAHTKKIGLGEVMLESVKSVNESADFENADWMQDGRADMNAVRSQAARGAISRLCSRWNEAVTMSEMAGPAAELHDSTEKVLYSWWRYWMERRDNWQEKSIGLSTSIDWSIG